MPPVGWSASACCKTFWTAASCKSGGYPYLRSSLFTPNVGAGAVSMHPIDRYVALDDGDKFMGDHWKNIRLTHDLPPAVAARLRLTCCAA